MSIILINDDIKFVFWVKLDGFPTPQLSRPLLTGTELPGNPIEQQPVILSGSSSIQS